MHFPQPIARPPAADSFAELMSRWEQPLFDFAWQYLRDAKIAGDLVASCFVRYYQLCPRGINAAPWLFGTLAELCLQQSHRQVPDELAVREADAEVAALVHAIASLPHSLKAAWMLQQCAALSSTEMAQALAIGPTELDRRLHRARQLIATELSARQSPANGPAGDFPLSA